MATSSSLPELRAAAVVTNAYVGCTAIKPLIMNQATIELWVSGVAENIVLSIKPQWSVDGTNWVDEPVNTGAASGTEMQYTRYSKVFLSSLNSTGIIFAETFNRWGVYNQFRLAVKGASASTTALLQIIGSQNQF